MNNETYFAEAAKSQHLRDFVVRLIREHFEPTSETSFKDVSREVAEYFDKIGDSQLASYVLSLIGDESCWVPM